jgi:hypothetical protein
MPNLVALFDFERLNPADESERYGEGSIQIFAEREPKTQEEFDEVTKAIFRNGNYAAVGLKHLFYDENDLFANLQKPTGLPSDDYKLDAKGDTGILDDIIQGETVDD